MGIPTDWWRWQIRSTNRQHAAISMHYGTPAAGLVPSAPNLMDYQYTHQVTTGTNKHFTTHAVTRRDSIIPACSSISSRSRSKNDVKSSHISPHWNEFPLLLLINERVSFFARGSRKIRLFSFRRSHIVRMSGRQFRQDLGCTLSLISSQKS